MKILLYLLILLAFGFASQAMPDSSKHKIKNEVNKMSKTIQQVQEQHTDSIMVLPGVEGIGIGKEGDNDCIVIFVNEMTKELETKLPKNLEGFPVRIEITGKFQAYPKK